MSRLPSSKSYQKRDLTFSSVPYYNLPDVFSHPEYGLPDRELQGRQVTAFVSYNDLARSFGFYTLTPPEYDPISE